MLALGMKKGIGLHSPDYITIRLRKIDRSGNTGLSCIWLELRLCTANQRGNNG